MNRDWTRLEGLVGGYRAAQALLAANRLGLFAALGTARRSAAGLARRLKLDARATRMLCDALAALKLLNKRHDRYANAAVVKTFLLPDAPQSQSALLAHHANLYDRWGQLAEVVKTGRPPRRNAPRNEQAFARAMASSARLQAAATARALDLRRVRSALDVGGGPGVYALALAQRQPRLTVTVLDTPKTLDVTREMIAAAGLPTRVLTRAGDAFTADWGRDYDLILLSNVIHVYSAADNQRLVQRAARALAPGGRLCLKDFILHPDRTGPEWSSLFAINMLLNTDGGNCYTLAELQDWLKRAGLRFAGCRRLPGPSRLVLGVNPARSS